LVAPDGRFIARDGNRFLDFRVTTSHAEILVMRAAAGMLGRERIIGCHLFVTLVPCTMCAGAISFARIERLYFGAPDEKAGAVEHGVRFFAQSSCHHAPEVYGGIAETKAAALLREFFRQRR
jgi:tRNA(adenine34) deaminase